MFLGNFSVFFSSAAAVRICVAAEICYRKFNFRWINVSIWLVRVGILSSILLFFHSFLSQFNFFFVVKHLFLSFFVLRTILNCIKDQEWQKRNAREERYFVCCTHSNDVSTKSRCENRIDGLHCILQFMCLCMLCSIILFIKAFSRLFASVRIVVSVNVMGDACCLLIWLLFTKPHSPHSKCTFEVQQTTRLCSEFSKCTQRNREERRDEERRKIRVGVIHLLMSYDTHKIYTCTLHILHRLVNCCS